MQFPPKERTLYFIPEKETYKKKPTERNCVIANTVDIVQHQWLILVTWYTCNIIYIGIRWIPSIGCQWYCHIVEPLARLIGWTLYQKVHTHTLCTQRRQRSLLLTIHSVDRSIWSIVQKTKCDYSHHNDTNLYARTSAHIHTHRHICARVTSVQHNTVRATPLLPHTV